MGKKRETGGKPDQLGFYRIGMDAIAEGFIGWWSFLC